MNTPAHASDTAINRLIDTEAMRASQFEDWHIDINDDGCMIGECPRCGGKDISAVTPEHLKCNGCEHVDGQKYTQLAHDHFEPGETAALRPWDESVDGDEENA